MSQSLLESLKKDLLRALEILGILRAKQPIVPPKLPIKPPNLPIAPNPQVVPTPPKYLWDNFANSRHSVRVICDEEKLTLQEKNLICAVIQQESNFNNKATCKNKNKRGEITSTDWGICQINDTKGWHIGKGLAFSSVEYLLEHPEEAVRYMIRMYKAGKLKLWVAFSSSAYKKFLPK